MTRRGHFRIGMRGRGWLMLGLALWLGSEARLVSSPVADGTVMVRTVGPGEGDRFRQAEFSCWLPPPGRPVRAVIIHQHGCGNSSPETSPAITDDFHWRALARKHDCALIVPRYTVEGECANWNDPDSGSERALLASLAEFAERSGRPELASAPWLLWGHSGGSSWSVQMMLRYPERVLAVSLRGGCHKQFGDAGFRARFAPVARAVPLLLVWGKHEAVPTSRHYVSWEPMQTMYRELRAQGGRVSLALDPRSEHHCADSRLLIIPYFDAVLTARGQGEALPGTWVRTDSRVIVAAESAARDPDLAWLPTPAVARRWQQFVTTGTVEPARPPTRAPSLWVEREATQETAKLRWHIEPELEGGLAAVRLYRDGILWKEWGREAGGFLVTNRDSPLRGLRATDSYAAAELSPGHEYALSFVDSAGAESPRSAPVKLGASQ